MAVAHLEEQPLLRTASAARGNQQINKLRKNLEKGEP